MSRKYYTIEEAVKRLQKIDPNVGPEDVYYYVREKLLHPIIYLDSLPAHACEITASNTRAALGFCCISAYWDKGNDEVIGVFNAILRDKKIALFDIIKMEHIVGEPVITNWKYENHDFPDFVPRTNPKPFTSDLHIESFILLPNECCVNISNIVIAHAELEHLKKYLLEQIGQENFPKSIDPSLPNLPIFVQESCLQDIPIKTTESMPLTAENFALQSNKDTKKIRHHELMNIIQEAYYKEAQKNGGDCTSTHVYKKLQQGLKEGNMVYDPYENITNIDDVSISWRNWENQPRKPMSRRRFQNIISDLRTKNKKTNP